MNRETMILQLREAVKERYDKLGADVKLPTLDDATDLMAQIYTCRGGRARMLTVCGKKADDRARCLHAMILWHGSAGSLWGPMGWQFRVEDFEELDTLAIVIRGGKSTAADNWRTAINGG